MVPPLMEIGLNQMFCLEEHAEMFIISGMLSLSSCTNRHLINICYCLTCIICVKYLCRNTEMSGLNPVLILLSNQLSCLSQSGAWFSLYTFSRRSSDCLRCDWDLLFSLSAGQQPWQVPCQSSVWWQGRREAASPACCSTSPPGRRSTTARVTPRPSLTTMQLASSIRDKHTSCGNATYMVLHCIHLSPDCLTVGQTRICVIQNAVGLMLFLFASQLLN